MTWRYVGGGSGAGFRLFTQTADGQSAIYANAAARDAYFTANPGDLTILDDDQFLIIKLLDDGFGSVAYQQRQASTWVDVTSLVQGETGPPGATGNSFFFDSIMERDQFFSTSPNEQLLEPGLPVCVNVGEETVSNYVWNGENSPPTYDPTDWVVASLQVSTGTIFLGPFGASLSSGNEVLSFQGANGVKRYMIGIEYNNVGSGSPVYWQLDGLSELALSPAFTQTLTDPQTLQYQFQDDYMLTDIQMRPAAVGELRIQAWLGTDENGPMLLDSFFTVNAGDIGTIYTCNLPNDLFISALSNVHFKLSQITTFGDLQTTGPFNGQTVSFVTLGVQAANQINFVTSQSIGGLPAGEVVYGNNSDMLESEPTLFWDSTNKNLGINETLPLAHLHVNSQGAATVPIVRIQNNLGSVDDFLVNADPNGTVTSVIGSKAIDISNGDIWIKRTATGNTGWEALGSGEVSGPTTSVNNEVALFDGTTGDAIKGGSNVSMIPSASAIVALGTTSAENGPSLYFYDNTQTLHGLINLNVTNNSINIHANNNNDIIIGNAGTGTLDLEFPLGTIDCDAANFDIDTTGAISFDASGSSNFTCLESSLTLSATGAGTLTLNGGSFVDIESGITMDILSNATMTLESTTGAIFMTVNGGVTISSNDSAAGDSQEMFRFNSIGTDSGIIRQFVGSRDPEGNITTNPGSIYFREAGADSGVYMLHSSGNANTPWLNIAGGSSILTWGNSDEGADTTERYLSPGFGLQTASTTQLRYVVPRSGIVRNMYVRHNVGNGNGNDIVYTLHVNGVASSLTVTLASTGTQGSNLTDSVAISAGDEIDVVVTKALAITTSPENIMVSLEIY